jgi:SMC interacting uncharacterized protein involved in chromosome segregation
MWFPVLAWVVLLIASALFAREVFGLDPAHISTLFSAMSGPQRFATSAMAFAALSLAGSAIWQAYRLERQGRDLKSLRARFNGVRQGTVIAHGAQNDFDAAVQNLFDTAPEQTISSLQDKLAGTEQRAALQQGQTEAVDMQARLDDIRARQQALRGVIGEVAEKRRLIEPIFGELRERQRQLERSLTEMETGDSKGNLAERLKDLGHNVSLILARLNIVQESMATLNRFKDELGKSKAELEPLRSPGTGIHALIDELGVSRDQLSKTIDELESSGDNKLGPRVEALSESKTEIVQKVARLDDCYNVLNAIRLDFEELGERQLHLERSLAEVETDSRGRSLVDRQNALNEFVIQSRLRLRTLQDSLATLNQFREELARSQADLVPLQAPVFGIEAVFDEASANRDDLVKTLDEIESSREEKLGSRVEALGTGKREIEERMAQIFDHFTKLDTIRKDIGGIFTTIRNTLNRIG